MYQHLTASQMQQVLSRTSEHNFAFNIERYNESNKLPVSTETSLYGLFDKNKVPESADQRLYHFRYELDKHMKSLYEIYWKVRLIGHYETPDEVKLGVGYRGFEQLLFEMLARAQQTMKETFGEHSFDAPWARLLEFNRLCSNDLESARKDVMVEFASGLGALMIACRSEAMKFGMPMENVLEAIIGAQQEGFSIASAIKTTLFGCKPDEPFFDMSDINVSMSDNKFHK